MSGTVELIENRLSRYRSCPQWGLKQYLWIDRTEERMFSKNNLIRRAGNHGRRRHGELRHDHPNVRKSRPQVGDNCFGCFRRSAGAVKDYVERFTFEPVADLHEGLDVLISD